MEVRILRRREVERLTRLSKASIYRKMRTERFRLQAPLVIIEGDRLHAAQASPSLPTQSRLDRERWCIFTWGCLRTSRHGVTEEVFRTELPSSMAQVRMSGRIGWSRLPGKRLSSLDRRSAASWYPLMTGPRARSPTLPQRSPRPGFRCSASGPSRTVQRCPASRAHRSMSLRGLRCRAGARTSCAGSLTK